MHLIEREYAKEIDTTAPLEEQVIRLAELFRDRLTNLVSQWVRVGYCQGNFNSDNCAAGGFTLDYGPFGFCEFFEADYQPWTGGGRHFSFLNQPIAAQKNFDMFCRSLMTLLEHEHARDELKAIVMHLIEREYAKEIDTTAPLEEQVIRLAELFRDRLTNLVSQWVRVGYCQGNFNSDNCAAGGFTLDYGPFGFCEFFEADYQPWTGGGRHFSFLNQPIAAQKNFDMFCRSLMTLLEENSAQLSQLNAINDGFSGVMERAMERMWATKLGLASYDHDLLIKLLQLMLRTGVDYNMFFRELSSIPEDMASLTKSFYYPPKAEVMTEWEAWLQSWRERIEKDAEAQGNQTNAIATIAENMRKANPKFTWREWLIVPAYKAAEKDDFTQIHELQNILTAPYDEQSEEVENKYYQLRPLEFFSAGGVAHYSCSS